MGRAWPDTLSILYGPAHPFVDLATAMQLGAHAPLLGGQVVAVKYKFTLPSGSSSGAGLPATPFVHEPVKSIGTPVLLRARVHGPAGPLAVEIQAVLVSKLGACSRRRCSSLG